MAIKIRIIFTAAVITLLLLTEPITCALSTSDGEISSTTSQDGASITSTVFQENSQHTTESTNEQNTRSFVSHVMATTSTSSNHKNESFATVIDERYENSNSTSRSTTTKNPVVDSHQLPSSSSSTSEPSMSAGIRVLYRMTSTFLDVIQPPGKNLYDELGMESGKHCHCGFAVSVHECSSAVGKPVAHYTVAHTPKQLCNSAVRILRRSSDVFGLLSSLSRNLYTPCSIQGPVHNVRPAICDKYLPLPR